MELLANSGEMSATDIFKKFSASPPAISQHLKVLRDSDMVSVEKRAQQRIYTINPAKILELEDWLKKLTKQWEDRFNRLDTILAIEKEKLRGGEKNE